MSLIPFILELADELHEFNRLATGGMGIDDFGFGIYPHELQPQHQQQHAQHSQHPLPHQQPQTHHQQQRRPRSLSQFYWLSNLNKSRHHPYYRGKSCCVKSPIHLLHDHHFEKESAASTGTATATAGSGIGTNQYTGGASIDKEPSAAVNVHHTPNSNTPSASSITPQAGSTGKSAYSVVNKNGFQVSMNVKQFAPNELTVKTIDNCIVVEGQHEDKEDGHGVISRHFIRKYMLPKGYDPNEVLSTLSSDGILTIKAPPPAIKTDDSSMERIVDVQQTVGVMQAKQATAAVNVNANHSGKGEQQVNATAEMEKAATSAKAAAAAALALPASVTAILQQRQQKQQQLQEMQKKQQLQQSAVTVECVQEQPQQQHQQPTATTTTLTTKDLQAMRERNAKLDMNESTIADQETETRTATAQQNEASSLSSIPNNANNANNNNNSENNYGNNCESIDTTTTVESKTTTIDTSNSKDYAIAATATNLEAFDQEKEVVVDNSSEEVRGEEKTNEKVDMNAETTATTGIANVVTASLCGANMPDATNAEQPMETEEEQALIKGEIAQNTAATHPLATTETEDVPMPNFVNTVVNSTAIESSTAVTISSDESTQKINSKNNNDSALSSSAIDMVESNGIETIEPSNVDDADIEMADAAALSLPETHEILVVTNNGISELKTDITDDGLTISLETATVTAEINDVTAMDAEITESAAIDVVVEGNGDGLDDDGGAGGDAAADAGGIAITIGGIIDNGSGVHGSAIDGEGGGIGAVAGCNNGASVEDSNGNGDGVDGESVAANNLIGSVETPSAAELVAAADASILLAKTQCGVDVDVAGAGAVTVTGDVIASKTTTIITEELTN